MTRRSLLTLVFAVACQQAACLYEAGSPVKVLKSSDFNKLKQSGAPFLVEFFSPGCGHCVNFAPEYEKTAKTLNGILQVVAVDDRAVMGGEQIQGFPTVRFFSSSNESEDYKGERKAEAIVAFVFKKLQSITSSRLSGKKQSSKSAGSKPETSSGPSEVIVLTDSNFEKLVSKGEAEAVWFVEFYAPWCGHCTQLAPTWEKLATQLKGKIKVAKVDATANEMLSQHFEIKGFPTIKLFPPFGDRKWLNLPKMAVSFEGARGLEELTAFAMQYAGAAASVTQVLSQAQLDEKCEKGVCIIAFLPHILESKATGRNEFLKSLNNVLRATYSMPVTFLWTEGGAQFDFEEKLHLAFGFPAVVALNFEKKKFAIHKGGFSEEALRSFITGMMAGRVSIEPLPAVLPPLNTVEPWDGKDGQLPPEDDVSDDEL